MHFKYSVFAILDFVSREAQDELAVSNGTIPRLPNNIPSFRDPHDPLAKGMWRLPGICFDRPLDGTDVDPIAQLAKAVRIQFGITITHTKIIRGMYQYEEKIPRPPGAVHRKKYTKLTKYYYVPLLFDDFMYRTRNGSATQGGAELSLDLSPEQILMKHSYYPPHQAFIRKLHAPQETV